MILSENLKLIVIDPDKNTEGKHKNAIQFELVSYNLVR
jgi:hypothetical protein